jgi:mono/diheme cytochrome c family protein
MKTRTRIAIALTTAAMLGLVGCPGDEAEQAAPAPPERPATPEAPAAPATPEQGAPGTSGEAAPAPEAAPAAATTPDPKQGEQLYATYCASCHGPRGEGDGPAGAALDPKPARHSDGAYMNALSNEHLFKVIKEGGPAVGKSPLMAPWGGTLSDEQIWDVVAFVRSLAQPPYEGSVP